ncbi:MAG: PIN domain-containing protein [Candidatus Micrarchaeota archaeon]|nr:PIN domain-containing protein [Candidatus Micrarchaeota archaeon]
MILPYADTDFFLALADRNDRLNHAAQLAYETYKGDIYTSLAVAVELVLVGKRRGAKAQNLMNDLTAMALVDGVDRLQLLQAAKYIDELNVGIFDAFHAALCRSEIMSSDHVYDRLGIRRIALSD